MDDEQRIELDAIPAYIESLLAKIGQLEAERDALKLALEKCLPLLHEVILDHRDPRSPRYNECDRENKECLWCELAKTAIHEARGE